MVEFGTAGIRGDAVERVTPRVAMRVGRALASMTDEVVLGWDGRVTSPGLADAAAAGLTSGGATVLDVGMVPTAALAAASRDRFGMMITASHNPPSDNGIKLFDDGVEFDREAERTIERRVDGEASPLSWDAWGSRRHEDVLESYLGEVSAYLGDHGRAPTDVRVAVDCGHGVGGLATPRVLQSIGADCRAVNATPDGHFPGRDSKPTPASVRTFGSFVAAGEFDLGLAHDGDADRIVVLDGTGEVVHEDTILAILAHHYVSRTSVADPVVVTTPNASERVDERVAHAGGRVVRTALGGLHEGIADVGQSPDRRIVFAGEPWKHIHPALGGWIDGIVSAGLIVRLVAAAGSIEALREPVRERPYEKQSVHCPDDLKAEAMTTIAADLERAYPDGEIDTKYGVRVTWPDASWVLVRPSGTEPKVRIYLESDDIERRMAELSSIVEDAVDSTG